MVNSGKMSISSDLAKTNGDLDMEQFKKILSDINQNKKYNGFWILGYYNGEFFKKEQPGTNRNGFNRQVLIKLTLEEAIDLFKSMNQPCDREKLKGIILELDILNKFLKAIDESLEEMHYRELRGILVPNPGLFN